MAFNLTPTSITYNAAGKFGQSLVSTAASRARFTTGGSLIPLNKTFTFEAFLKLGAASTTTQIFAGCPGAFWAGVDASSNLQMKYGFNGTGTSEVGIGTTATLTVGVWHHVQISMDAVAGVKIWLNGTLAGSSSVTPDAAGVKFDGVLEIGALSNGSLPWCGATTSGNEIDSVVLWRTAKTTATVPTAAYTGAEAGLIARYAFDGNLNDTATPAAATTLTYLQPSAVYLATAASFIVAANGSLSAPVTITPSDGAGGTFTPASVTLNASTPSVTFTYTAATIGAKTISVANNGGLSSPSISLTVLPTPSATKYPDDPGILYSPYNWAVSNAAGKTINSGAYFKTIFTGASCTLNFDISAASAPLPRLLIRVDGRTWQSVPLAASIAVTLPSDQTNATHILDVLVDAVTNLPGVSRWSPQNTAVVLTSIVLASASETVTSPKRKAKNLIVYGDSITEGTRTLNSGAASDVDRNSSVASWAYALAEQLGAEVGVIGFGSTGWTTGGLGGVPKLSLSYNLLWAGQARDFATYPPDWVVINGGVNDNLNNIVPDVLTTVNGLLAATPESTRIALVRPFANANQEVNLQTGQATCSVPGRVFYITSQGWWLTSESPDAIHPYGWAGISKIAPRLAAALQDIDGIPTADVGLTLGGELVILN